MEASYKVVLHLDEDREDRLKVALANVRNLLAAAAPRPCEIEVLANSAAVRLFLTERSGEYAASIVELADRGVRFALCGNALRSAGIAPASLLPTCEVVPAGILELVELQDAGYAYVKP